MVACLSVEALVPDSFHRAVILGFGRNPLGTPTLYEASTAVAFQMSVANLRDATELTFQRMIPFLLCFGYLPSLLAVRFCYFQHTYYPNGATHPGIPVSVRPASDRGPGISRPLKWDWGT